MNTQQHLKELNTRGFTFLPSLYDAAECAEMRRILDDYWMSQGSPSLAGGAFGFTIHPMMTRVPDMAPFLDRAEPIEILAGALQDEVRLVHLGARISGPQSVARLPWHNHYSWDTGNLAGRDRIERLLIGIYADGTQEESGPLIALPRGLNDELGAPLGDESQAWPGEQKVEMPPGSVAIFDTALWHAAARGTGGKSRRLWGAHFQGWSDARTHPEDNAVDAPEIAAHKAAHPRLKRLIDGA